MVLMACTTRKNKLKLIFFKNLFNFRSTGQQAFYLFILMTRQWSEGGVSYINWRQVS